MPSSRHDRARPSHRSPGTRSAGRPAVAALTAVLVLGGGLSAAGSATAEEPAPAGATGLTSGTTSAARTRTLPRIEFTTASFNVLGANHTAGRGGMGPGYTRGKMAAGLVRKHKTDIVGFQELQRENYRGIRTILTKKKFGFYPGLAGKETIDLENSVAWKKAKFKVVRARTIKIPYFHGQTRRMPLVLLEHRRTGRKVYAANFHNPASTAHHGNNEKWRDRATRRQIRLVKNLVRKHQHPILFTGDFNEHEEYFCKLTGATQMYSASGGSRSKDCRVPKPRIVDLVFGSRAKGLRFAWYRSDESAQVRRTTDHPLVVARTVVKARKVR
jgi:endonuclease/exonuclease/phosphatase family metal-dependent hydrolase